MQAENRGFAEFITTELPVTDEVLELQNKTFENLLALIERAQQSSRLRGDISVHDIPLILMGNAGVLKTTRGTTPPAWRRHLSFIIPSFDVMGQHALEPGISQEEISKTMF